MQSLTFKDLKKRISLELTQQESIFFERLQNKPFWIWNIEEHKQQDIDTNGDCCFNHIVGLPTKGRIEMEDTTNAVFQWLDTKQKLFYLVELVVDEEEEQDEGIATSQLEAEIQNRITNIAKHFSAETRYVFEKTGVESSLQEDEIKEYLKLTLQEIENSKKTNK